MNKIIEEVSRALCRLRVNKDDYVDEQWLCFTHDAYAAIACIAGGELDEKALRAALAPSGFLPERETAEAIKTYLSNLKESV